MAGDYHSITPFITIAVLFWALVVFLAYAIGAL